ncbi:hypothetical protein [Muricomes intestini]|jgi:hypothetical protein|uniref:hypothetical protein n=1 Tax=Muricomes intestini TaxID=1796634 RepID=UPI002FDB34EB
MSKKVSIISASPRRGGNSEMLAASFTKGAEGRCELVDTVFAGGVDSVGDIAGHPALVKAYQTGKEVSL